MPSSASTRLRFELQATGENLNTWGGRLNAGAIELVDQAIAGVTAKVVDNALAVLTANNFLPDEARSAVLRLTGLGGTLTIPAVQKLYLIDNACTGNVVITAGGAAATLLPGEIAPVYCDAVAVRRLQLRSNGNARLRDVADPVDAQDAATRAFVLAQIGSIGLGAWQVRTANYVAAVGDRILADTSAGAFTITLPPTPAPGSEVTIIDVRATWHLNAVTVARNGQTIAGLAEDLVLNLPASRASLVFTGATWAAAA